MLITKRTFLQGLGGIFASKALPKTNAVQQLGIFGLVYNMINKEY